MFRFQDLKSIHLEITNNCQARCPMCARNEHGGLPNPLVKINEWTFEDYKKIFTIDVLNTIEKIYFCGNFGDPMLNNDLIHMCRWTKEVTPHIRIGIHTNGSARPVTWWQELAYALPKEHMIHFGIDGLEDTHSLYRVGTDFKTIIRNAKAFIDAGGIAEWTFIKFKHNEHQVEECQQKAKELGFSQFMLKNSSRFLVEPKYDVWDKNGTITHTIEPPSSAEIKFMPKSVIDNYKKVVDSAKIDCYVQGIREIYIDTYKTVMPCCWVSSIPYTNYDPKHVNSNVSFEMKSQYQKLLDDFGGIQTLHAFNGIKNIIDSEVWQTIWERKWNSEKMITCARTCGKFDSIEFNQPNDQFIESKSLTT